MAGESPLSQFNVISYVRTSPTTYPTPSDTFNFNTASFKMTTRTHMRYELCEPIEYVYNCCLGCDTQLHIHIVCTVQAPRVAPKLSLEGPSPSKPSRCQLCSFYQCISHRATRFLFCHALKACPEFQDISFFSCQALDPPPVTSPNLLPTSKKEAVTHTHTHIRSGTHATLFLRFFS